MTTSGDRAEQAIALVAGLLDALDEGNFGRVRELTGADFETVPVMTGEPMDRERWLSSHAELERAFPSLRRNPDNFRARLEPEREVVEVDLHVTAVHDRTVELPALGIGPLAATGLELRMPAHHDTFVVRDGLVRSVSSRIPAGGGLAGMIATIEAEIERSGPDDGPDHQPQRGGQNA